MGFLSTLLDVVVGIADAGAKNVDRMSDSQIERKFNTASSGKTVQEIRDDSAKIHELSAMRKNSSKDNDR